MAPHSLVSILFWSAAITVVGAWRAGTWGTPCPRRSCLQRGIARNFPGKRASVVSSSGSEHCYSAENEPCVFNGTVTVLDRGAHHLVVSKPPSVVCHHSDWSGSGRKKSPKKNKNDEPPEVPMLQRAREAVGERVNLIHRLDRGASGCLLMSLARSDQDGGNATAVLQESMSLTSTTHKTYLALVRGEGILKGRDFRQEGWFEINRPIKNEAGTIKNATSYFRFIAGQGNDNGTRDDRPRASLVLARIKTGRWHQIRKHLNGLSHPIIGDSTHGNSRTNREWRERWGLEPERTCLHLLKLELPPTPVTPNGISVVDSLPPDMKKMLEKHLMPEVLEDARKALEEEGLSFYTQNMPEVVEVSFSI